MNIMFFLTPKHEVAYVEKDHTLRQALEKMEYHRYTAVPVIDQKGHYVGTITEGDILWGLKNKYNLNLKEAEHVPISHFEQRMKMEPVYVNADIEDLILKAMNQNFVPVIDDNDVFIGIVTRKDIIQFCYNKLKGKME